MTAPKMVAVTTSEFNVAFDCSVGKDVGKKSSADY